MALLIAVLSLQRSPLFDPRALGIPMTDSSILGTPIFSPWHQKVHVPEERGMIFSMVQDRSYHVNDFPRSSFSSTDRAVRIAASPSSNVPSSSKRNRMSFCKKNSFDRSNSRTILPQTTNPQADDTYVKTEEENMMDKQPSAFFTLRIEESLACQTSNDAHGKDNVESEKIESTDKDPKKTITNSTIAYHTFHYPPANVSFYGASVSMNQFKSWLQYNNLMESKSEKQVQAFPVNIPMSEIDKYISTEHITIKDKKDREKLRQKWFNRQLLSGRTELLSNYPSDDEVDTNSNSCTAGKREDDAKRGGLSDLLTVYANRHTLILEQEKEDPYVSIDASIEKHSSPNITLQNWLEREYGHSETKSLTYEVFSSLDEDQKLKKLQHFLDWFRARFPYYWDRCEHCASSFREDSEHKAQEIPLMNTEANDVSDDKSETCDEIDEGTFLGYVYPNRLEVEGRAARTELYHCHKCKHFTRFPRYNDVSKIIGFEKGRCGEYSILLYRILRSLNHQARWVVDWSDHVWAECLFEGEGRDGDSRWVHLDPCEAAVDNPLLYQGWGKKQKMIVAFWAPRLRSIKQSGTSHFSKEAENIPLLEDVTQMYTSDGRDVINTRRGLAVKKVEAIISTTEALQKNKLQDLKVLQ